MLKEENERAHKEAENISLVSTTPGFLLVGEVWEQMFHRGTEAAWVWGEGLKLEQEICANDNTSEYKYKVWIQAEQIWSRNYLSATEGFWRKSFKNLNMKYINHAL